LKLALPFPQFVLRLLDSLKGTGIGNCHRNLVGKDSQPHKILLAKGVAAEQRQDTKSLLPRNQRITCESSDVLAPGPVRTDPLTLCRRIWNQNRFASRTDFSDLSITQRDPSESPLEEGPILRRVFWRTRTGHQMKTLLLVAAIRRAKAGVAQIAWRQQPDSRQGHSRLTGQALNDQAQNILCAVLAGNGSGKRE
jgi:hypothetical protein